MLLSMYDELNDLLLKWFKQVRAKNIPLSGPGNSHALLKGVRTQDFKASNGWLQNWKNTFSIAHFKVCGESGDINMDTK